MPVSGLVLTTDPTRTDALAELVARRDGITVGPASGARLPVVVESDTVEQDREAYAWLDGLAGVSCVEIAFMDFSDVAEVASPELRRMGRPANRRGK